MYLYFVYNHKLDKFLINKSPILWGRIPTKAGIFTDPAHIKSMIKQNIEWALYAGDYSVIERRVDLI